MAMMTAATDEKNLVHLVDPTQVPKGRSYFEVSLNETEDITWR